MRSFTWVSIIVLLAACFAPDFYQKPCDDQAGCPPTFTCVIGRCAPAQRCTSQERSCDHGLVCNVVTERCENPDMATPAPDMSTPKPTLSRPNCATESPTAASFFPTIIQPYCTTPPGCHFNNIPPIFGDNANTFRNSMIGIISKTTNPKINLVTPNNVDESLLLYKVTGLQGTVQTGLEPMPPYGRAPLSVVDQCKLINWVASGAN